MSNNTNSTLCAKTLGLQDYDFEYDDWVETQFAEDRERFETQLAAGMYDDRQVER
jgi:hypothetical protein